MKDKYALTTDGDIVERICGTYIPLISDDEFVEDIFPKEVTDFFASKKEVPWSCGSCLDSGVEPTFAQALQSSLKHERSHLK